MSIENVKCLVKKVSQKEASESRLSNSTYGCVDFVHTEARIQICEWSDGWPYPGRRECRLSTNIRRVIGVENLR